MNSLFGIIIVILVLFVWFFVSLHIKRGKWRKAALQISNDYLAARNKNKSQKEAFLSALGNRYGSLRHSKSTRDLNLNDRYDMIMIEKVFPDKQYLKLARQVGPNPSIYGHIHSVDDIIVSQSPYEFEGQRFDLMETIYCMLVIEFPWVANGRREHTLMIIDEFLQKKQL